MAAEELRTLAFACRPYQEGEPENMAETNLIFLGITGMRDPIRPEAIRAVADFQKAGVSTVMITGDHVATAFAVGKKLGIVSKQSQCMTGEVLSGLSEDDLAGHLDEIRVFARVSPKDKVKIVRAFQKRGQIVAMTGDGVNDAPSLKAADVGIAMGKGGTDVARQASDMILTDDNFATIRRAMEEGRGVYENIRKSVLFLLSSNLGEILTMFAAVLMGLPSPLQSAHILWINLITDSAPGTGARCCKNEWKKVDGQTAPNSVGKPFSKRRTFGNLFLRRTDCRHQPDGVFYRPVYADETGEGGFFGCCAGCVSGTEKGVKTGADLCLYRARHVAAVSRGRNAGCEAEHFFAKAL